jgi:tRNA A-37 threonylcarbamoyl transferase component Bud32
MFGDLLRKFATYTHSAGFPVVKVSGRVWHLTPEGQALFGPDGPQLERWITSGSAVVVKANPARTVYKIELPLGTVFVKHCRVKGMRAWGREVIRPPKARLEFDNAVALRERGVPAVEPLAWGAPDSHWPGESFLITRGLTAVPFLHFLEHELTQLSAEEQRSAHRQLASEFARFLAKLHDAGVAHPDPHPGNVLVEMPASHIPRFALIDLHDVCVGPPLPWAESRQNLTLFNRWFQMRASRTDRARFWHTYRNARVSLLPPTRESLEREAKELERETHVSNLRLWAGRERRWLGSHRSSRKIHSGAFRGFAVRDLPEELLQVLLADPDAMFKRPDARILKDCTSATVAAITMPAPTGQVPVILKRVNVRSWLCPIKNAFRWSQVYRSWANGHALRDRWIPTPRPLAVFHRRRYGLPAEGYLLTEMVPESTSLQSGSRESAEKLAQTLRAMHDRGVSHRDLKAPNILLAHGTEPMLIDLVGVRTRAHLTMAKRARELARLNASFVNDPKVTRSDRLRFLLAYLAPLPRLACDEPRGETKSGGKERDWKNWWELISRATVAKVAKNRRAGRVLG